VALSFVSVIKIMFYVPIAS